MSATAAADAAQLGNLGAAAAAAAPSVAEATLPQGESALQEFLFSLVMPTRRMHEATAPIGAVLPPAQPHKGRTVVTVMSRS